MSECEVWRPQILATLEELKRTLPPALLAEDTGLDESEVLLLASRGRKARRITVGILVDILADCIAAYEDV